MQVAEAVRQPAALGYGYNYAIGYLRAFTIALVVAHHASLAYHPYAPPPSHSLLAQPRWWMVFPIVDSHRWIGFSAFVDFNDRFFMSLMFLLSGLFVWSGLRRKRPGGFLRDRLRRLGIPFLISAAILAPFAYYPAYLQATASGASGGFWQQWLALGQWPAGPAWFVWVLLVFDCAAAAIFATVPQGIEVLGRITVRLSRRPAVFFAALVAVSAIVYVPLALKFFPLAWTAIGPFTFQTSRIIHYFVYFLSGIGIGAAGFETGLLAPNGKLARRWWLWALAAFIVFALASVVAIVTITTHAASVAWAVAADLGFVLSCAASVFAFSRSSCDL